MASGLGTLTVWLTANNDGLKKGFADSQQETSKWKSSMQGAMTGIAAGLGAIGIGAFVKSSVSAYSEQEDAVNSLESALRLAGDNVERYSAKFQKFSSDMQSRTVFGDEQILGVMAYGKAMGITADQLEEAGRAAVGLAAKYNIDLSTSMGLIAKANLGNTTALKRYGVILDENMTKEEKFAALLKIGGESFSLAEAKTQTFSGSLSQLKNSFGEIQESVGKTVIEGLGLVAMFKSVGDSCMSVSAYINGLDDATKNVITRTGLLVMGTAALTGAYKALMMTGIIPGIAGLGKWISSESIRISQDIKAISTINLKTNALIAQIKAVELLSAATAKNTAANMTVGLGQAGGAGRVFAVGPSVLGTSTFGAGKATIQTAAEAAAIRNTTTLTKAMGGLGIAATFAGNALKLAFTTVAGPIGIAAAAIAIYRNEISEWVYGVKALQDKSDEFDEKRRNLPALGVRGIIAGEEAAKAKEAADKKYKEDMLKPTKFDPAGALEERKYQDKVIISKMASKTLEDKLKIIAYERNAILRESYNTISRTGDAEKDKEAEQKRLRDLREDDLNLQIKQSDLIKEEAEKTKTAKETFEKTGKDMAFEAMTREEKINALYNDRQKLVKEINAGQYTGEDKYKKMEELANIENDRQKLISEKNKDPLRTESSVVSAVQKGSSEALKIENTRTQRDNKIADNTLRTAKGVEKIIEAVKGIGKGVGGFTLETAV